ncbi:MAG: Gfo/Idh/MocA family protein, partial [Planctomycetaceae bacterium]
PQDLTADIEEGHLSSALCHLGNVSYRLGAVVPAKEAEERLAGDEEARGTFERFAKHLTDNGVSLETTKVHFGPKLTLNGDETFNGEHAGTANAMLTREYRKGFEVPDVKNV